MCGAGRDPAAVEALWLAAGGVDDLRHPGAARMWLCGEQALLLCPCQQALGVLERKSPS